jgi:hypothetical protein
MGRSIKIFGNGPNINDVGNGEEGLKNDRCRKLPTEHSEDMVTGLENFHIILFCLRSYFIP